MTLELSGNKLLHGIEAPSNAPLRSTNAPSGIVPALAKASAPVERQQGSAGALSIHTGETEGFQSNFLMLDNIIDISNTFNATTCEKCAIKTRRKKGSAIVCITSGFEYWISKGYENNFYWLTLSSPVGSRPIQESWNQFKFEVRRLTTRKLVKDGYIKQLGKTPDKRFLFEYFVCFTSEGNGVAHIIFVGDKLPVEWIRTAWNRIHGQSANYDGNVQIRIEWIRPSQTDRDKLSKYVLGQYVANQKGYIRHTCSRNWIYQGYRNDWLALCSQYDYDFEKIGAEWHTFLLTHTPDTPKVLKKKPSPPMVVLDTNISVEIPYIFGKTFEFPREKEARLERRKRREERKRLKLLNNEPKPPTIAGCELRELIGK